MTNLQRYGTRPARLAVGAILVLAALGAPAAIGQTLTVSPSSIQFTYTMGDPSPAVQSVTVTVPSGGAWSTFDESPFYDATPSCAFGLCPSGSQTTIVPYVFALPTGIYTLPLTVRASGFPDVAVPVTLTVLESAPTSPTITVDPPSVTFKYTSGAALPDAQTVRVTVPAGGSWSTFSQSSFYNATSACALGSCPSDSTTTLTPSAAMTAFAAGTYEASLTVRASGFTDVVVPVVLIVSASSSNPPPSAESITVTPASITFTYTRGAGLPAAQTVTVIVPGGGSWSTFDVSPFFDASSACSIGGCPSGSATTLLPASGMATFPPGTHQETLTVRASGFPDVVVPVRLIVSGPASQTAFYVSPAGSDVNPGTQTQPFATLERARSVVRTLTGTMKSDITVFLRGGEYPLSATVVFDQADSGTNGFSVIYRAYPGEEPILTGARTITGWTLVGDGIYKAPVGGLRFRQLFVNGTRAIRARTPNAGSYATLRGWDTGGRRIEIDRAEISQWSRLNQVEMVILGAGVNQANLRVGSFAVSGSSALVVPLEPERTRIFSQGYPLKTIRPYYFENAYEFLDTGGEWYLNTQTDEVFYKVRADEDIATLDAVAPQLETLVRLQGALGQPVHHLQFYGITFQGSTWLVPTSEGYIGDQASIVFTEPLPSDQIASYPGHRLPAAVHLEAADNIRFERNVFRQLGASAVNLYMGANDNVLVGNVITDVSGSGISVDLNLEGNPADPRKVSRRNVITNNYIAGTGRDYYQTVGIMVGYGDSTVVEHNELLEMPFTGISVGWGWEDRANAAQNNVVRYNHVSGALNLMDDGGGIYLLSRQPGTVVAENYVHDLIRPPASVAGIYGFAALYLDNGSNLITVRDNVVQNVDGETIRMNDTGAGNTLANNDGASPATISNAGLEPAYQDIRPE
jgi:hypothetical protein